MPGVTTAYQNGIHSARPAASAGCILYACSTHSLIYRSDGSAWTTWMTIGTSTTSVATDAIWDAAGDLAVGSGADTAVKLSKGNAGAHLAVINGALAWDSGTSFPGSVVANDRSLRTDNVQREFFYDGTRWRSTEIFEVSSSTQGTALNVSKDVGFWSPKVPGASDIWLVDVRWFYQVATTHSGTQYWSMSLHKYDNTTDATITTLDTDKSTLTYNAPAATAIGALVGTANTVVFMKLIKTSTPGDLTFGVSFRYQLVAT